METISPAADDKRILASFIENVVLLTGLFIFIGSVYQQAYLRTIGLRVETISLNQLVPRFTDPLVIGYIVLVWLFLSRLPERWYVRFAELVNPATWRKTQETAFRIVGIGTVYLFLILLNYHQITTIPYEPVTPWEFIIPPSAFLARQETAIFFVVIALACALIYYFYARIRRKQLDEVSGFNVKFMKLVLTIGVPIAIIFGAISVSFVFPATYGTMKANIDIDRMRDTKLALVEKIHLSSPSCVPTNTRTRTANGPFVYLDNSSNTELHYLGSYSDMIIFLKFDHGITHTPSDFEVCLISPSIVEGIQFANPNY